MYNFLCGIEKDIRKEFIRNIYSLLKPQGKIILRIMYMKYTPKEIVRSIISFFYWTFVKGEVWQPGDVLLRSSGNEFCRSHYYTRGQIRKLLKGKDYTIDGETIIIHKA